MDRELNLLARYHRARVVDMIWRADGGHPGGSLSCTEILVALYERVVRPHTDRVILSKGHACAVWYSVLAERGYFPAAWLADFKRFGSPLQAHPDMQKTPGVDFSAGSLGQGLSVGAGMALAERLKGQDGRVFVVVGDGELNEGQVWEAALFAAARRLDNLTVIVDRNRLQLDGPTETVLPLEPLAAKWESMGFGVVRVNGHDFAELLPPLGALPLVPGKPSVIVAETEKGHGVSFMANRVEWHGAPISAEQRGLALRELGYDPEHFDLAGEVARP